MKNKKRIVSIILALTFIFGGIIPVCTTHAASYYFAGKYMHTKYATSLSMNEYSDPVGKVRGTFKLSTGAHVYLNVRGTLKKTAKNTYTCKKGKSVFTFKVYKKKVVVKMNKKALKGYYDYRGTYKLKKRYYS